MAEYERIAAVSRFPGSIDVWWVQKDGSIQGAKWEDGVQSGEGEQWFIYELAPAGSAYHITALSRHRNTVDVWWIGEDGSVQGARLNEGEQRQRYELAPAGSAYRWGGITSVSKIPGSMDVFWVGTNGTVQGATWLNGYNWNKYPVAPEQSAYGKLTAVSRTPGSVDVFWIGQKKVKGARSEEDRLWKRYEIGSVESTNGSIKAVSTDPWSMEVFWHVQFDRGLGNPMDHSIFRAKWEEDQWQTSVAVSYGEGVHSNTGIAALSRFTGSKDLIWISKKRSVMRTVRGAVEQYTISPPGSAWENLTAVTRFPGSLDVMWVAYEGSVHGASWVEGEEWKYFDIAPPPPPPPPPLPTGQQRIDVILESMEGRVEPNRLAISGLGFQANESIKVIFTVYVNNKKVKVDTLNTQSDTAGTFFIKQEVQCNLGESTIFEVKSFGSTSGSSNKLTVSCQQ
ncbi:hypothetical protein [Bacillus sp. B15-48]|uniref:hypothetical protein n=1 Tax=Bacillus sp. B15-48 TaxID=1548601 RepID=UPI00193F4D54|nr:hypothetical protein [Bacillus sp. B15-48]MBM4764827.1 hypothetical protein [Bacillus sp. B15-48]